MDYKTLVFVYAGILVTVAGALVITWRQNPTEVGPRSWAIGSLLGTLALVGMALSADGQRIALSLAANLVAWLGVLYYARGTRQFANIEPTPRWLWAAYLLAAAFMFIAAMATPYAPGAVIVARSFVFTVCCFDVVRTVLGQARLRGMPSYFLALFFGLFGATHLVRLLVTAADYGQAVYQRPIDMTLLFIGILGGAGTAMGFSMMTTARLMTERDRNLRELETGVSHLREQFESLAAGHYDTRARTSGGGPHMDAIGQLFNDTAVQVGKAFDELRDAQAQLQMADRLAAMGTVAAGVAHEINNPLAYVMSNVDFVVEELEEGRIDPADVKDYLEALRAAQQGSERVRKIVLDLKHLSRRQEDSDGRVQINTLIESAGAMLHNEIRHHAELILELGEVPEVNGAEAKLGQVFLNLIQNAAQAIPAGHAKDNHIRVRSFADGPQVVVEVSDTGAGIAPTHLDRIFDAFFTTKPVGVGTGLGLALCHRVATELGGRIEVESEVGKGSLFRVVLPAAEARAALSPVTEAPRPESGPHRRVLFIDDEVEVGKSAQRILGKDHQVDLAGSARAALPLIAANDYDLILCDLMMPDMSGMELFERLEAENPRAAARTVFMSGGAFSPEGEEFIRRHQSRTVAKPLDTQTLRQVVAHPPVAADDG